MSANRNNFIRWTAPGGSTPTTYGNEGQYNELGSYAMGLIHGDEIILYANFDTPDTTTFAGNTIDLISEDGMYLYPSIGALSNVIIGASGFRFNATVTIPDTIPAGCYRFQVANGGTVRYNSNLFTISTVAPYSKMIRYRNPIDIFSYRYESTPSFKNTFRINLVQRHPNYQTNRIGYQLVDGAFNPVRTTVGNNYEFITEAYNELDHEAWNSATIQELEIYNDNTGEWESFKRSQDSSYEVEWQNNYPTADGTIRLEQTNTYSSNKNV